MATQFLLDPGAVNWRPRLELGIMLASLMLMPGGLIWSLLWPGISGAWLAAIAWVTVLVRLADGLRGIEKDAALGVSVGFGALIAPSALEFELVVGVGLLLAQPSVRMGPYLWMIGGGVMAVLLHPKPLADVEFLIPSFSALPATGLLLLVAISCGNRVRPLVILWLAAIGAFLSIPGHTLIALPALLLIAACHEAPRTPGFTAYGMVSLPVLFVATLTLAPATGPSDQLLFRMSGPMDAERWDKLMSDLPPSLLPANLSDPAVRHARTAVQLALLANTEVGNTALQRVEKGIDTYRAAARQHGLSPAAANLMDRVIHVSLSIARQSAP